MPLACYRCIVCYRNGRWICPSGGVALARLHASFYTHTKACERLYHMSVAPLLCGEISNGFGIMKRAYLHYPECSHGDGSCCYFLIDRIIAPRFKGILSTLKKLPLTWTTMEYLIVRSILFMGFRCLYAAWQICLWSRWYPVTGIRRNNI